MCRLRSLLAVAALFAATAAAADTASSWPQTFTQNGDQLVVYQPQLDAWANRLDFSGRVAAVVTPAKGAAVTGVLRITARTNTDAQQRTVTLTNIQITDAQFPTAPPPAAARATTLAKALLPQAGLSLSLDYLLAALVQAGQSASSAPLGTTAPTIFLAEQPTRLVLFDGAPSFATVAGTNVQYAINTNWTLLRTVGGDALYLLDSTGWLTSDTLTTGVWEYAAQLPPDFSQLPDTKDWQDVKQSLTPAPADQAPLLIDVSTTPAELIVIVGEPQYQQVPGTGIYAVTNTDSLLFWDGYAKAYYYLVAGRWFRTNGLGSPWTYATGDLPADMAKIPADGPLAAVLASVPNTPEAREAALQAQIPHVATVSRSNSATVAYDGDPQFAPIDGTSLAYAVNTSSDVIRVGDAYYLCQNGVWFTAAAPAGPWSVATAIPDPIYTIPPNSPLYNVTYVRLYQVAADQVVDGYTDGYLGEYVADGVVTWGTGYYYPPYLGAGAFPRYYARPYTYGCDAFYNPANGSFHRAGYGYGPYGGVAAGATYDATTGTYVRGAAAYGPYQSGEMVQAYNPRTGTVAVGESRSNPYASWQQGVVYGPSGAARADSYTNDRGTVARVQTAGGAEVVAASNGDRSAAAVRAPGGDWYAGGGSGDWYAGGDNNLYRRTTDGWQRADAPRADAGIAGGVGADRYAPSHYVPSEEVGRGLDEEYAARQRQMMTNQRYNGAWGQRGGFSDFGGGRYGGVSRGGGRR